MKTPLKIALQIFTLLIIATSFVFIASSCGDPPPDEAVEPTQPEPKRQDNSRLQKSACEEEHVIGVSSCPQSICQIPVYCGKDENSCTADSAIIVAQKPGLTCTFANGETWTKLDSDPTKGTNLNVEFTCNVPNTIEDNFIIRSFKDGLTVDEEPLKVKVTVK